MSENTEILENLSPVDSDEMAFAMALFDGAIRGRVRFPAEEGTSSSVGEFDRLSDAPFPSGDLAEDRPTSEDSLMLAMAVLWHHYQSDERQQTICARLMAFHSLLTQTGRGLDLADCPTYPNTESPFLQPSAVRAVASEPLNEGSNFDEASFPELISMRKNYLQSDSGTADRKAARPPDIKAPAKVKKAAWELAKLLYIFETCAVPVDKRHDFLQFGVLKKLCAAVARIGGSRALQAMLSRVLASTRSEFPWLRVAEIEPTGDVKWSTSSTETLTPPEAVEGELALVGSLVDSLRSTVGEDVTADLLKSVWPLASFPRRSGVQQASTQADG